MKLDGIHHITAITGDAPRNVDFYARVLGLRLVKKSGNQDDPTVYHLFYAQGEGAPRPRGRGDDPPDRLARCVPRVDCVLGGAAAWRGRGDQPRGRLARLQG